MLVAFNYMLIMFPSNISSKHAAHSTNNNNNIMSTRNCGTYGIDKRPRCFPTDFPTTPLTANATADLQNGKDGKELRKIQLVLCLRIA